jgi:hypothetical protein
MSNHTTLGFKLLVSLLTRKLPALMEHGVLLKLGAFFWVMMASSLVDKYHSFGGPCCLRLQGTKRWRLSMTLHGVASCCCFIPVLLSTLLWGVTSLKATVLKYSVISDVCDYYNASRTLSLTFILQHLNPAHTLFL